MKYSTGNAVKFIREGDWDGPRISAWMQQGVHVPLREGETVTTFISRVLSMDEAAVAAEVKTLILNNGCVDNPESQVLGSGDTLVLSGAMPGLVGAMLRSDSPIKAMRQTLTPGKPRGEDAPTGMLRLKLFNTVLRDHRDDLLKCGFYVRDEDG
jgi:hypothetical protein